MCVLVTLINNKSINKNDMLDLHIHGYSYKTKWILKNHKSSLYDRNIIFIFSKWEKGRKCFHIRTCSCGRSACVFALLSAHALPSFRILPSHEAPEHPAFPTHLTPTHPASHDHRTQFLHPSQAWLARFLVEAGGIREEEQDDRSSAPQVFSPSALRPTGSRPASPPLVICQRPEGPEFDSWQR